MLAAVAVVTRNSDGAESSSLRRRDKVSASPSVSLNCGDTKLALRRHPVGALRGRSIRSAALSASRVSLQWSPQAPQHVLVSPRTDSQGQQRREAELLDASPKFQVMHHQTPEPVGLAPSMRESISPREIVSCCGVRKVSV